MRRLSFGTVALTCWWESCVDVGEQERQDTRGCAIHAHLALMWRSADLLEGGIGRAAVSALLQAQAFLSAHYSCESADAPDTAAAAAAGLSEEAAAAAAGRSAWKDLGVPEVEIFTLFQRFRADVLRWCEQHLDPSIPEASPKAQGGLRLARANRSPKLGPDPEPDRCSGASGTSAASATR